MRLKIDVLGTKYSVYDRTAVQDGYLSNCDGYCDKTAKVIIIKKRDENCELACFEQYRKKVLRHEIIHAFLFESGLAENFNHPEWGHDETMVDWFAIQHPKIYRAFKEAGCIEN